LANHAKSVAITGAGSGLGEALARHYGAAGWRVAVTDEDLGRAEAVTEAIRREGGEAFASALDVREDADFDTLTEQVMKRWGGLQQLINNAGVAAAGTVEATPQADWDWVLAIDLLGVVRGCRHVAPLMRRQGEGHIVNMASFAGLAGAPGMSSYGVAKAGVVALSEGLRAELHPHGVGVSVVCPAFVATRLTDTMRETAAGTRAQVQRWMERSPVSAAMLAATVFDRVQAGDFMILTHRETRWLWRLKRWLPERYFRLMMRKLPR